RQDKVCGMSVMAMTPEQSFFAVFCIEALSDELNIPGDAIYRMLTENSDILDGYIVPGYDALHTQGKDYIVHELVELMQKKGLLS
ncbi:MAG: DUF3791 domain-containing protein, partial [Coriobacteriia bacterium]|nr:DUF3791 domain-containing protein [Coriobacteriia bacterium]